MVVITASIGMFVVVRMVVVMGVVIVMIMPAARSICLVYVR
jgi:hypothetical protein